MTVKSLYMYFRIQLSIECESKQCIYICIHVTDSVYCIYVTDYGSRNGRALAWHARGGEIKPGWATIILCLLTQNRLLFSSHGQDSD